MDSAALFSYLAPIVLVAAIIGGLLVFVIRGARARRATEAIKSENAELRDKLRQLSQPTPEPSAQKPRWLTGTEITAIAGLIGTVLGGFGTIMGNLQSHRLEEADRNLSNAQAAVANASTAKDVLSKNIENLIGPIDDWLGLKDEGFAPKRSKLQTVHLEKRQTRTPCGIPKQLALSYDGSRPAVLYCAAGTAIINLDAPTKLLLLHSPAKP